MNSLFTPIETSNRLTEFVLIFKGTSINSFCNTNVGIFFRYKAPKKTSLPARQGVGYR